ncbi:glycosyltransferase family 2 protein [Streptococcus suis]|uniref:Glycosyltransferase family 2 protein n=1 Tax=Streptococcus suis TaxID=1307 RepID=A0A4T2GMD8_STRSU|nr:glycosyltransferase family 2 protein [Streptococcus suis]MBM7268957.1 glycosyltransferase family 2 protein [Streptococcus suis]MBM7269329.1 glycosyltransferase family 2 protein [Streptococcus suis]TII00108.1 glycosyltransferase family 2 protein [Streptococcus suis]TII00997.1 glycosyltransferase family 2 protein [Streptococcus suis]
MVVLVATLDHENVDQLIDEMNLSTVDSIVIHQTRAERKETVLEQREKAKIVYSQGLGLSVSRNEALSYAENDAICQVADDDLVFVDNYQEIVSRAYKEFPDADIIIFYVDFENHAISRPRLSNGRLSYLDAMRVSSVQISFKKSSFTQVGLSFDERFGIGAQYGSGEETILLFDALGKGLKLYSYPEKIASLRDRESHWDRSNTPENCQKRGAIYKRMTRRWYWLLILQFAIRKRKMMLPEISLFKNIYYMLQGARNFSR